MGLLDSLKRMIVQEETPRAQDENVTAEDFEEIEPRHITEEEFHQLMAEGVLLVDFWAEWCAPCHVIAPSIDELARNYGDQAVIAKLNVDNYPNVAGQLGIMGIPTVIIFKDGKEFKRFVGVQPYGRMASALEEAIAA